MRREPENGWVCTAERRPGPDDASHTGMVLAVKGSGHDSFVTVAKWSYCTPKAYPFWVRYPALPEQEQGQPDSARRQELYDLVMHQQDDSVAAGILEED